MSHRKVLSEGNVPFSWQEKPGISKLNAFSDDQLPLLTKAHTSFSSAHDSSEFYVCPAKVLLPPPPCWKFQPPPPFVSSINKTIWEQEEDPFLVALKKCTDTNSTSNIRNCSSDQILAEAAVGRDDHQKNNNNGVVSKVKKSKFMSSLWCMYACDVKQDTRLSSSNVPPLPRTRTRLPQLV